MPLGIASPLCQAEGNVSKSGFLLLGETENKTGTTYLNSIFLLFSVQSTNYTLDWLWGSPAHHSGLLPATS